MVLVMLDLAATVPASRYSHIDEMAIDTFAVEMPVGQELGSRR